MIDGEVRNIEVKVSSVGLLPPEHLHPLLIRPGGFPSSRFCFSERESFFLFPVAAPTLSLSKSCLIRRVKQCLSPLPSFWEVCPKADSLSSSLIDHLVIGSRVVEVVSVPAGSVHVSMLKAHLNTTSFHVIDRLCIVFPQKLQLEIMTLTC